VLLTGFHFRTLSLTAMPHTQLLHGIATVLLHMEAVDGYHCIIQIQVKQQFVATLFFHNVYQFEVLLKLRGEHVTKQLQVGILFHHSSCFEGQR
jgi:hypothetical protein